MIVTLLLFGPAHVSRANLARSMYNGVDDCGQPCRAAQLKWLEADLQAAHANRDAVPWIVAFSHFPLCELCPTRAAQPACGI